ncbi:MAG: sortase [Chloroflexi bacterium]|nr:sortase [Chloroflexota bacterium]
MADKRTVDELSLEELEAVVERRRRIERARTFAESTPGRGFRPVTVLREDDHPRGVARARSMRLKTWRERVLLAVEIMAVLGLIAIIVGSLTNLQTLNQEVIQAHDATPDATNAASLAAAQELPGSSFPPASESSELPGSSFPPEPAPPALGVRLQAVAALPVPTPGPRSPTRIVISAIDVDWPVVEGDSWDELKQGIGHRVGSANPGERGNLVLSGHDDVYGEPFRDLEKLNVGSEVLVYAGGTSFRYVVKARRVVAPSDLSVLAASKSPVITLITCTPYRVDTSRLVVIGELVP